MPPPPAQLMDELVEEILLRLPPDSPASLIRAGLVCKRWHRLVSDPGFRCRFSDFHGRRGAPPPMLGFMVYSRGATRFIPTPTTTGGLHPHHDASSSSSNLCSGWRACDARHGRVLLRSTDPKHWTSIRIAVWNPITGDQLHLPDPPPRWNRQDPDGWTAAVLCAGGASCDHLGCHSGPCVVVLVGTTSSKNYACVYSSESGAWSEEEEPTFAPPPHTGAAGCRSRASVDESVRSALVGNTLYFALCEPEYYDLDDKFDMNRRNFYTFKHRNILEYDLVTRRMSVVELPRACGGPRLDLTIVQEPFAPVELTTMEDDDGRLRLGFVRVEHYSTLYLWSRDEGRPAGWVLRKTIQLNHLTPPSRFGRSPWECLNRRYLVGSAEGVGVIFLVLKHQLFTIDLRSGRVTLVYAHKASCLTVPYINFCTPRTFKASDPCPN